MTSMTKHQVYPPMKNLFTNDTPWLMIRPIQPWQTIKSLPPWETIAVMHHHNHFSHTTLDETLPSCVLDKPSITKHLTHSTHVQPFHPFHSWQTISIMLPMKNRCIIVPHDKQVDLCYMKNLCNHTTVTKHFTNATHHKLFPPFTHDQPLNQYYPIKL